MVIPDHLTCLLRNLYAGQEATVKPDMEHKTGSKSGKEYVKAVYCHPAYLTYMQSEVSEVPHLCQTLCDPHGLDSPWNSPGKNTGVGSLSLPQRIFLTQGLNPGLLQCRQILYQLSHKGSPIFRVHHAKCQVG